MKNILICNQKGGVGKSLIADELAFSFERSNILMNFYDLDSQGGTIHKSSKVDGAEVSVIDTPGALQTQLKDWLSDADIIVIPTRTTSRDIKPLQRMQRAVQASVRPGVPVLYVLNGWNRWRASGDFLEWFRRSNADAPVYKLPQSEQFVQAGARGMSVVEYARHGTAATAVRSFCDDVLALAGYGSET